MILIGVRPDALLRVKLERMRTLTSGTTVRILMPRRRIYKSIHPRPVTPKHYTCVADIDTPSRLSAPRSFANWPFHSQNMRTTHLVMACLSPVRLAIGAILQRSSTSFAIPRVSRSFISTQTVSLVSGFANTSGAATRACNVGSLSQECKLLTSRNDDLW